MEVKRIVFFAPVCVLFVVSLLDIFGTNKHRNLTQNRIVQVLVKHGEAEAEALTVDVTFPKRYTVLVNTFRGRDDAVLEVLKGYSKCDRVDKVFVVWNDFERPIPHNIASFAAESQGSIVIQVQKSTSLSNRWLVPDLVETTAIFSTDEDIMYSCTALEAAFSEWLKGKYCVHMYIYSGIQLQQHCMQLHHVYIFNFCTVIFRSRSTRGLCS